VVLLSVTEGDDKPDKYPVIFRKADLVLLTKTDLLPAIEEFSTERARAAIGRVHGPGPVLEVSAKKGAGLDAWTQWIVDRLAERRQAMGRTGASLRFGYATSFAAASARAASAHSLRLLPESSAAVAALA
jgi:hypothetical protein